MEVVPDPVLTTVADTGATSSDLLLLRAGLHVAVYARMPVKSAGGVNVTSRETSLYDDIAMFVGASGTFGCDGTGSDSATSVTTVVGVPEFHEPCAKVEAADPLLRSWARLLASSVEGYTIVPVTTALPGSTLRILHVPPGCTAAMFEQTWSLSA